MHRCLRRIPGTEGRIFSSWRQLSTANVDKYVRNAHASEIFRSSFYKYQNSDSSVPVEDLDQLIISENARPSLLIGALDIAGTGLGLASRIAPKPLSEVFNRAVDDATHQQFNDSIRTMQLKNIDNIDVKETLKFHRDLNTGAGGSEDGAHDDHDNTSPENNAESSTNSQRACSNRATNFLSGGLYQIMKLTNAL